HRGLVAISEGGFGFESRGHGRSPADQGCCTHGNASALLRQAQVRFYVLPYEIHATSGIAAIGDRLWEVWIPSAQFKTCGATDLQGLGDLGQRQELRGWLASGRLNQYLASTVSVCITIGGGLGVRNWAWRIHGEFLKPLTQNLPGVCHFRSVVVPLVDALQPVLFDMVQAALRDFRQYPQRGHHGRSGSAQVMRCPFPARQNQCLLPDATV